MDAQSGHIGGVGRRIEERTNSLCSNKARQNKERPTLGPASRGRTLGRGGGREEFEEFK